MDRESRVEAAREKFVAYQKKKKKNTLSQTNEQKKKKKDEGKTDEKEKENNELTEDSAHSSITSFPNEDEEDEDEDEDSTEHDSKMTRRLLERVKELEDVVEGKDVALKVALQESGSLQGMEVQYQEQLEECRKRLLDFQAVVEQRDNLIQQLSESLQQAIASRDTLQLQGEHLADEVALLQRQLQATSRLVQGQKSDDYVTLQNKLLAAESCAQRQSSAATEKDEALRKKDAELERKCTELNEHKLQSAAEVQQLMREVEQMHQQLVSGDGVHQQQLAALRAELEENFGLQIVQIKEELRLQFMQEKVALSQQLEESRQRIEELCQQASVHHDRMEAVRKELANVHEANDGFREERSLLQTELSSQREHVAELRCQLATCKSDDAIAQELDLYRESHALEVSSLRDQVNALNVELQKASQAVQGHVVKLEECKRLHDGQLRALKQTHAAELDSLNEQLIGVQTHKWQVDQLNLQLQEKITAEERLKNELKVTQDELVALKQTNEMHSYMKEIDILNAELHAEGQLEHGAKGPLQGAGDGCPSAAQQVDLLNMRLREKVESEVQLRHDLQQAQDRLAVLDVHKQEVANVDGNKLWTLVEDNHQQGIGECEEDVSEADTRKCAKQSWQAEEILRLKRELEARQLYIDELETIREQVADSSRTKDELINELSVCVRSLKAEDATYRQQLDTLHVRLDEESHVADENLMLRCSYESEIQRYKDQVTVLNGRLQKTLEAEQQHLAEISLCQSKLSEYKVQLEVLNTKFTEELTRVQHEYSEEISARNRQLEATLEEAAAARAELSTYKDKVEELGARLQEMLQREESNKLHVEALNEDISALNKQIKENDNLKVHHEIEVSTYLQELEDLRQKVTESKENHSKEVTSYKQTINSLEEELVSHEERVKNLNVSLEGARNSLNSGETCLKEYRDRLAEEERRTVALVQEKEDAEKSFVKNMELLTEEHARQMALHKQHEEAMRSELLELSTAGERYRQKLAEHVARLESCNADLEEKSKLLTQYKEQVAASEAELARVKQEMKLLEARLEEEKAAAETLRGREAEGRRDMEVLKGQLANALADREACMERLTVEMDLVRLRLQEEQAETEKLRESHKRELEHMESQLLEKNLQMERLEQQVNEYKADLTVTSTGLPTLDVADGQGSLQKTIESLTEEHEQEATPCSQRVEALQQELQEAVSKHQSCECKRKELADMLEGCRAQLVERDCTIDRYRSQLDRYESELSHTKEGVKALNLKLQRELNMLEDRCVDVQTHEREIALHVEREETMQSELTDLESCLRNSLQLTEEYRKKLGEYDVQLSEQNDTIDRYRGQLAMYQEELFQTNEDMKSLEARFHQELKQLQCELLNMKEDNRKLQEEFDAETRRGDVVTAGDGERESSLLSSSPAAHPVREVDVDWSGFNACLVRLESVLTVKADIDLLLGQRMEELGEMLINKGKGNKRLKGEEELMELFQEVLKLSRRSQDHLQEMKQERAQLVSVVCKLAGTSMVQSSLGESKMQIKCKEENKSLQGEATTFVEETEKTPSNSEKLQHSAGNSGLSLSPANTDVHFDITLNSSEKADLSARSYSDEAAPVVALKWMEQCAALEHEKKELVSECGNLTVKLREREIHERQFSDDVATAQLRCEKLEKRLIELEKCESTIEKLMQERLDLELRVCNLENDNRLLKESKEGLRSDLVRTQMDYEDKLKRCLHNLFRTGKDADRVEELIVDLEEKSKETIILREQVKCQEEQLQMLSSRMNEVEKSKEKAVQQFECYRGEASRMRAELEDAWQEHEYTEKELGRARKELVLLKLRQDQLEMSQTRLLDVSTDVNDTSILSMQREVHRMVEELAAEVIALKHALGAERLRVEQLTLELKGGEHLKVQEKLELILESNAQLLAEKEVLLAKLKDQEELPGQLQGALRNDQAVATLVDQQNQLMEELAAYREQHSSLAEVVGSAGLLQETLRRQKQELMHKLQEKAELEHRLEEEQANLRQMQLKLQLQEQQLQEKDNIQQELHRQKAELEAELHEIEDRLRDQVDCLQSRRLQLEAEIRSRDLQIRRYKLEVRAKQVEIDMRATPALVSADKESLATPGRTDAQQKRLCVVRAELDVAHARAMHRLKRHLMEQFALHETQLQENFTSELLALQSAHQEQLAALQEELLVKTRQLEGGVASKVQQHLGVNHLQLDDLSTLKETHECELENIRTGLDEGQVQLYALLKHKFESFAQHQIEFALRKLKNEHNTVLQQEVATLTAMHQQEMETLRARLEQEKVQELLSVRQALSIREEDGAKVEVWREEDGAEAKVQQEEDVAEAKVRWEEDRSNAKEGGDGADGSRSEPPSSFVLLAQLKQLLCKEYMTALEVVSTLWQESWRSEPTASAVRELLSSAEGGLLEEGLADVARLEAQDSLLDSWEHLLDKAEALHKRKLEMQQGALLHMEEHLDAVHNHIADRIQEVTSSACIAALQAQVQSLEEERDQHRSTVQRLSTEHAAEVAKLRDLVAELEGKHTKEMEGLRQYFEQKVTEVEKHYSEEIMSQHSRHLSGSSCGSDSELVADMYYTGGGSDVGPRISTITHLCDSYAVEPSYKDLEDHYRADFEKRLLEYRDQLESVKRDLQNKYEGELAAVRDEYGSKVEKLVKELSESHQDEVRSLETKHKKEVENMKAKWREILLREGLQPHESCRHKSDTVGSKEDVEWLPEVGVEVGEVNESKLECIGEQREAYCELRREHCREVEGLESSYERALQEKVDEVTKRLRQEERQRMEHLKAGLEEQHAAELRRVQHALTEQAVDEVASCHADAALQKAQLEHDIRRELELELEQKVEEITALIKANTEHEQAMFIESHNQMMRDFLEQHRRDLEAVKAHYTIQLAANEEVPAAPVTLTHHKAVQTVSVAEPTVDSVCNGVLTDLSASASPAAEETATLATLSEDSLQLQMPMSRAGKGPFQMQLAKVQEAHANDLTTLHVTWQSVLGQLIRGSDPVREMQKLKEDFIRDCTAKFQLLLDDLNAAYHTEVEESVSNCKLKEKHARELHEHELRAGYARQLHADVEQAKHDIATALEEQIQVLLAADESTPRPPELVQLQERLVAPFREQLQELRHQLEQQQARGSAEGGEGEVLASREVPQSQADITKERDQWKKMATTLRCIVEELMDYLVECEDQLNSTLVEELACCKEADAGSGVTGDSVQMDREMVPVTADAAVNGAEGAALPSLPKPVRRVHFAPSNRVHLIQLINEDSFLNLLDENQDISASFRRELEDSVERLKVEAAAVLDLAGAAGTEGKHPQASDLAQELQAAKARVAELEDERAAGEVVTEGFGEHTPSELSRRLENLSQLQDRATAALRSSSPVNVTHLQLLEELCRERDHVADEALREREDLQQQVSLATSPCVPHSVCCRQVEAADKQLRATRHFLEEQAAEREQERDEFVQEVGRLQELLRERERELGEQQRIAKEVEAMEQQVKEAQGLQHEAAAHTDHLQAELKAALDKIWILREIVTELEGQVESKAEREGVLEQQLKDLQQLVAQQTSTHQQLAEELESLRSDVATADLLRHVAHLEEQLMRHRQHVEQLQPDSAAVQQMKSQLRELEMAVDKRTKDLESLHVTPSSASCSSPSEDVSIREQMEVFRCGSPDELRSSPSSGLPLDELHRLQEKLQRHSRAEEAALKRIRDLEMQLRTTRRNEDEIVAERDVLQERVEEQLLKISSLQSRLDQQRRKVENEQTEAVMELHSKLQAKEASLDQLRSTLELRDTEVKKMTAMMQQMKEAVATQDTDWEAKLAKEHEAKTMLQEHCQALEAKLERMQMLDTRQTAGTSVSIPVLFDTLLAEKNAEIEDLHEKLQSLHHGADTAAVSRAADSVEDVDVLRYAPEQPSEMCVEGVTVMESPAGIMDVGSIPLNMSTEELKGLLISKESEIIALKTMMADSLTDTGRQHAVPSPVGRIPEQVTATPEALSKQDVDREEAMERLRSEVESLHQEKCELVGQVRSLSEERERAEAAANRLQREGERLAVLLSEKEKTVSSMEEAVRSLRREVRRLQHVLYEREHATELLQAEVDGAKAGAEEAEVGRAEAQRRAEALSTELEELRREVSRLRDENARFSEDFGSTDDLTGQVQRQLDLSAQLDSSLRDKLTPLDDDTESCRCPASSVPSLRKVLFKVLQQGMDALSFSELSYLHQLTCSSVGAGKDQQLQLSPCTSSSSGADGLQVQLQQQIASLKNEMARKEEEAAARVQELEQAVQLETKHAEEVRELLNREQQRSLDLENRTAALDRLQADLEVEKKALERQSSYYEGRSLHLGSVLKGERTKLWALKDDLQKERNNVKHLEQLLEVERERTKTTKIKDSELIESMRIKLENALDNEAKMQLQLEQAQWSSRIKEASPPPATSVDIKEQGVDLEEHRQALRQLEHERATTEQLRAEAMISREHKRRMETQLAAVHDQLSSRQAEADMLRRRVGTLQEAELRHQRRYAAEKDEVVEKARVQRVHLEQQVCELRQRLAEQDDRPQLLQEMARLRQAQADALAELTASKARELTLSQEVARLQQERAATPFVERLKNISASLDQQAKDNSEVALTLARLVEERQCLQARVRKLDGERDRLQASETACRAASDRLVQEKAALQLALAQCKAEAVAGNQRLAQQADMESRVSHLFGKYLRAESYRKALAWQKRYLLVALGGYQQAEAITLSHLAQRSQPVQGGTALCPRHRARVRFKSVAIVVIAIHRMRYLVCRWYRGSSIGGNTVLGRGYTESLFSGHSSLHGPRRQHRNSAASSSTCSAPPSVPSVSAATREMWQWERSAHARHQDADNVAVPANCLAHYIDRFDELQQRLGLAVAPPQRGSSS